MKAKAAAFAGVASLAAAAGIALAATSATAGPVCPPPLDRPIHVGFSTVENCRVDLGPILIGCDPGPCDPTAAAPQE